MKILKWILIAISLAIVSTVGYVIHKYGKCNKETVIQFWNDIFNKK